MFQIWSIGTFLYDWRCKKLLIIDFDYWDRAEDPTLFLCNPNNSRLALIPHYKAYI